MSYMHHVKATKSTGKIYLGLEPVFHIHFLANPVSPNRKVSCHASQQAEDLQLPPSQTGTAL